MSWETFFWGKDQGYQYRRFSNIRVDYQNIVVYRWIAISIMTFWLIVGFFYDRPFGQFIYMTTWGSYFSYIALILNKIATDDQINNPGETSGVMFRRWRIAVWWFEMALSFDVMITIMYWGFVRDHSTGHDLNFYYDIFIHILPLVFNLIEFFLVRWKFRLQHFVPIVVVGIIYGTFNYLYVTITGRLIYDILNWDPVYISFLLIVGLFFLWLIVFYIFLRITLAHNVSQKSEFLMDMQMNNIYQFIQPQNLELGNPRYNQNMQSTYVPLKSSRSNRPTPLMVYVPKEF